MSTLTTQRKVKESRVKESEEEPSSSDNDSLNILKIHTSKIGAPTKEVERKLNTWLTVFDAVIVQEAITRTQLNCKSFSYLNALNKDLIEKLLSRNPCRFGHPQITQLMISRSMKPRTKSLKPVLKG